MTPGAPTLSFELMPPRRPEAAPKFWETADALLARHPDFLSITYGAGGSSRETALAVLRRLLHDSPVLAIAHLTCVGASREDVSEVIDDFLAAGVRSFLALRGDPPRGEPNWQPPAGGVASAIELVALLREVEEQRVRASPGSALRGAAHPLSIAVATFVNGNPAAGTSRSQEVARLLAKQRVGAHFAITQLFYDADDYSGFVAQCRGAGVRIPILAGIMPVTSPERLDLVAALSGVAPPPALTRRLREAGTAQSGYGIAFTADLANKVLAAGAPGLHLYTFNQHQPALEVLDLVEHAGLSARQP